MSPPHKSFFEYNLTKPYPLRWFTPVTIIGAILAAALFTLLTFASSGFILIVETSLDPNATVASSGWLHRWPSFMTSKLQPTCQPQDFPVGSQITTNNTALTYTVTAVWQNVNDKRGEDSIAARDVNILPSLSYLANPLENCTVSSIEIEFEALDRGPNQVAYSEWGATVRSYIACTIQSGEGRTHFNITQDYDYVPRAASITDMRKFIGTNFLARDSQSQASLWWGESLLSTYWAYSTRRMQDIRENASSQTMAGIRKGTVHLWRNSTAALDIKDLDFFHVDYSFTRDQGDGRFDVLYADMFDFPASLSNFQQNQTYPNLKETNILTDPGLLQHFTRDLGAWKQNGALTASAWPGPVTQDYDSLKESTGPLNISTALIKTKYICQTPQLKSTSNLIVSILVADLILLQTTWTLFKLLVAFFCIEPRSKMRNCENCTCAAKSHSTGYDASNADGDSASRVDANGLASRDTEMAPVPPMLSARGSSVHRRPGSHVASS